MLLLIWIVICDLYFFQFIVLLNPDFNCCKSFLSFSVDKVTTGTYTFLYVIWNYNPVGAAIAGGPSLFSVALTVILAKEQLLDQ